MKKQFLSITLLFASLFSIAQFNVTVSNGVSYDFKKKPTLQAFNTGNKTLMLVRYYENFFNTYDAFSLENNTLNNLGKIKIDNGNFNNMTEINSVNQLGNKVFALVENKNKDEGKNKLTVRSIDEYGTLGNDEKTIGAIEYEKRSDPGTWLAYVTEDKKHLAVVMVNPYVKGQPLSCKYFFYDENFKEISSSNFTIGNEKKKSYLFKLLASNAGDFYLINEEFDKSYIFPVVYKKPAADKAFSEFPVMLNEPFKNFNYTSAIAPNGNLVVAGYYQEKKGFIVGDVQVKGVWVYTSDKPTVATQPFDKPMKNLVARGLSFLGNTMFITGEDVKQTTVPTRPGSMSFEENINYAFENILITGYDLSADTKYDLPLTRKDAATNNTTHVIPAFGVVNGKYHLMFSDYENKYDQKAYQYNKIPVLVSINKDGLMEQPVPYKKAIKTALQEQNDQSNIYTGYASLFTGLSCVVNNSFVFFSHTSNNQKAVVVLK